MDITPISKEEYEKAMKIVKAYLAQENKKIKNSEDNIYTMLNLENSCIDDVDFDTRILNSLGRYFIRLGIKDFGKLPIQELSQISKKNFLGIKSVGVNTFLKLSDICRKYGIELKE